MPFLESLLALLLGPAPSPILPEPVNVFIVHEAPAPPAPEVPEVEFQFEPPNYEWGFGTLHLAFFRTKEAADMWVRTFRYHVMRREAGLAGKKLVPNGWSIRMMTIKASGGWEVIIDQVAIQPSWYFVEWATRPYMASREQLEEKGVPGSISEEPLLHREQGRPFLDGFNQVAIETWNTGPKSPHWKVRYNESYTPYGPRKLSLALRYWGLSL